MVPVCTAWSVSRRMTLLVVEIETSHEDGDSYIDSILLITF